jgi:exodeoxyribonuclease V alpha subunit
MGIIVGIIPAKESEDKVDELVIQFDSNEVSYKRSEWNKIKLSYCCSIHKSQGSEFKMVLLPMVKQYSRMLQRNLLYTAVTRSKDLLILLGEEDAFQACVTRESAVRKTTLIERIMKDTQDIPKKPKAEPFTKVKKREEPVKAGPTVLTPQLISSQAIDPMIGMEDVTPAMFM